MHHEEYTQEQVSQMFYLAGYNCGYLGKPTIKIRSELVNDARFRVGYEKGYLDATGTKIKLMPRHVPSQSQC